MITEDYVTYEVGLLLREKGFDETCEMFYCKPNEGYKNNLVTREWRNSALREDMVCTCPTVSLAMKWLREEKNIYIEICRSINTFLYGARIVEDKSGRFNRIVNSLDSYEQACEEAIKYCLKNLI